MSVADAATNAVHLLFAGLWAGTVLFTVYAVLPLARDGKLNAEPLAALTGKLTTVSRVSALLLLLTGGHMAGTRYTADSLTGTTSGHLVLGMVALWLLLAILVEVGARRLREGTEVDKVREPARSAAPILQAAALVAALLLIDAGLLSASRLGLF